MWRFFLNLSIVIIGAAISLSLVSFKNIISLRNTEFDVPDNIHTIVLGPSITSCAINDDLLPGVMNLSNHGMDVILELQLLPKLLGSNPQIDTVLIYNGRYYYMPPLIDKSDYNEGDFQYPYYFNREYMPFIMYDRQSEIYKKQLHNLNFYRALFSPRAFYKIRSKNIKDYVSKHDAPPLANLRSKDRDWSIDWYDREYGNFEERDYTTAALKEKYQYRLGFIKDAIAVCQSHGVIPVLFCTPLYNYEAWCPAENYRKLMLENLPNDILVSDYEDFVFPSDKYYGDVHHLNKDGADYFSKHIAEKGLKTETLGAWANKR